MPASTTLILIRHGETAWNRDKRIQGHLDIPLSEVGLAQAARLACRFQQEQAAGADRIDVLYSSDLSRAAQTASPLGDVCGLPVMQTGRLRERSYGAFEGLTADEIHAAYPEPYARWQSRDIHYAMPDGESLSAFYRRIVDGVEQLVERHAGARIACVAHGGVLDCLYRWAVGLPLDAPRTYPLLNASINGIEVDGENRRIGQWGDVAHLETDARDELNESAVADRVDPRVV